MLHCSSVPKSWLAVLLGGIGLIPGVIGCHSEPSDRQATPSTPSNPLETEVSEGQPAHGWAGYYPFATGNRWSYTRTGVLEFTPSDPNIPPETMVYESTEIREIIGTEVLFGRTYFIEQLDYHAETPYGEEEQRLWYRYRQDRTGLYDAYVCEADPPGSEPSPFCIRSTSAEALKVRQSPSSATRTAWKKLQEISSRARHSLVRGVDPIPTLGDDPYDDLPEDIVRLQYPLHPGLKWASQTEPSSVLSEIAGKDVISVPAGRFSCWRRRVVVPDIVESFIYDIDEWYSTSGLIRTTLYAEIDGTNEQGDVTGHFTYSESLDLTDFSLVGFGGE